MSLPSFVVMALVAPCLAPMTTWFIWLIWLALSWASEHITMAWVAGNVLVLVVFAAACAASRTDQMVVVVVNLMQERVLAATSSFPMPLP